MLASMATMNYSCRSCTLNAIPIPVAKVSSPILPQKHALPRATGGAGPAHFLAQRPTLGFRRGLTVCLAGGMPSDTQMNPNKMYENIMKAIGARFVALKNEGNLQEIFALCSPDVDLYGTQGLGPASKSLTRYFSLHPELHHSVKEEDYQIMGKGVVGYKFVKTWRDKDTGKLMEWASYANGRNKIEKIHLGTDGRIVKVEVVEVV